MIKSWRAHLNLNQLEVNRALTSDHEGISYTMLFYYKNSFANPSDGSGGLDGFEDVIRSVVYLDENIALTIMPLVKEIKQVVFKMDPESASSLDGFSGMFFQTCWDIVGEDVATAVRYIFFLDFVRYEL